MFRSKLIILLALVLLAAIPVGTALAQVAVTTAAGKAEGAAVIWDDAALSDAITYSLTGVTAPLAGTSYEGWLISDDGSVKKSTGVMAVAADGSINHTLKSTENVLLMLGEQNSSGQTGWALLSANGPFTDVTLNLSAGTVESENVHIHSGKCGNNTLGGVVESLTNIANGASQTTVGVTLTSLRTGDFAINTHQKGTPRIYTTCANIPTEADAVTIALHEQNESGATGWATLAARGDKTEVVLNLGPGTLESESVHIHSGSCGNDTLGGVVEGLTKIVNGASMTTVNVTLASLRNGDLAVNTHQKGKGSVYTTCGNIPGGDSTYSGENLISGYNTVAITIEPVPDTDPGPSGVFLASHTIPPKSINHIRHLVSDWPGGPGGITTRLQDQLQVAIRHAVLARNSTTLDKVALHTKHVINLIEGTGGPNFDASAGIPKPGDDKGVLTHAADRKHAQFAINEAPGDAVVKAHGDLVLVTGENAEDFATQARDDSLRALKETEVSFAKIIVRSVEGLLQSTANGVDADGDGTTESIAGEGAAKQAYVEGQLMATYTLEPGAPQPVATATPVPEPTATPVAAEATPVSPFTGDTSAAPLARTALLAAVLLLALGGGLLALSARRPRTRG